MTKEGMAAAPRSRRSQRPLSERQQMALFVCRNGWRDLGDVKGFMIPSPDILDLAARGFLNLRMNIDAFYDGKATEAGLRAISPDEGEKK